MIESSNLHYSFERIRQIRAAIHVARQLGIEDKAVRRELVIDAKGAYKKEIVKLDPNAIYEFPSVAKPDLRMETSEVIDRAINKYLVVLLGDPKVPVLVDAIHAEGPNNTEIVLALREQGIDTTYDEVVSVRNDGNINPALAKCIKSIRNLGFDAYTGAMARKIHELTGASAIVAKKSRYTADANRYWWKREDRDSTKAREHSRSVRAANFWAVRRILQEQDRLGSDEQLTSSYTRLSIHGMKNNVGFDFAIAGSVGLADRAYISWFTDTLQTEVANLGITVDSETPKAVVALREDSKTAAYSGVASSKTLREASANPHHPAFGNKFETIQLEISNRLRTNKVMREKVAEAIANVIKDIPLYFEST